MAFTSTDEFRNFPVGPSLRRHLGLPSASEDISPSADDWRRFETHLVKTLSASSFKESDDIATVIEELVMMKLPLAALSFAESADSTSLRQDFRCALGIGSAAMMAGEFVIAEEYLRLAQTIVPEEIAPYTNMCELLYRTERDEDCLAWAINALRVDPNSHRVWELIGALYMQLDEPSVGERLRKLADEVNSWAGRSLAAQYQSENDPALRAEALEDLYHQGLRDELFLIELTAALGVSVQYEKIPPIVWDAEKLSAQKGLSWQLYAHAAQAYLAMENLTMARSSLEKALKQDIPNEGAVSELRELLKEVDESMTNVTLH